MTTTLAPTQPGLDITRSAARAMACVRSRIALLLMVFKVWHVGADDHPARHLFLVLGGLWGRFAPPRSAKDPPPTERAMARANRADSPNPPPPRKGRLATAADRSPAGATYRLIDVSPATRRACVGARTGSVSILGMKCLP